jgi:hypothetical protein
MYDRGRTTIAQETFAPADARPAAGVTVLSCSPPGEFATSAGYPNINRQREAPRIIRVAQLTAVHVVACWKDNLASLERDPSFPP